MSAEGNHGLKSLDAALSVLNHLVSINGATTLSEIARAHDMPASKVHRYLASFVSAGLVKQQGRSGRYDLGPAALQMGLAALTRHDFVNSATEGLPDLSAETGMTVLLAVWANDGATVVRWERGASPTDTSMGLGTTLPLLNSATGRVFLAWGPPRAIAPARDSQIRRLARQSGALQDVEPTKASVAALVARLRKQGFATVEGRFIPGLIAVSAPILDWQGEAQAAITLVGTDPAILAPDSDQVRILTAYCAEKSVERKAG
ncbi:transcriptional regulator, IclR family [Lutimaribacter pacificus]|uniref:Transcriptional regulator, IclR family n=1 Tax=Lutimaribacter pacificus TaxID=391948 RepID=A0A1H0M1F5_9RHOB|nr:IclR family transcriptional regulator [Lutimaribacter pacificus]SDO74225.1 transcriptional regulator, IclR family [Lutimaribacter pacificus]SHK76538.1 transcriptional regulator, IclR family [Lutimaribacter pacificus]